MRLAVGLQAPAIASVVRVWLEFLKLDPEDASGDDFPLSLSDGQIRAWQRGYPLCKSVVSPMLGGWHMSCPDGDWQDLADASFLVHTFAGGEPWIKTWRTPDGSTWVTLRTT